MAEKLAEVIETAHGSLGWGTVRHEPGAVRPSAYEAAARIPTSMLDRPFCALSLSGNHSRLWFAIAAGFALLGGARGR